MFEVEHLERAPHNQSLNDLSTLEKLKKNWRDRLEAKGVLDPQMQAIQLLLEVNTSHPLEDQVIKPLFTLFLLLSDIPFDALSLDLSDTENAWKQEALRNYATGVNLVYRGHLQDLLQLATKLSGLSEDEIEQVGYQYLRPKYPTVEWFTTNTAIEELPVFDPLTNHKGGGLNFAVGLFLKQVATQLAATCLDARGGLEIEPSILEKEVLQLMRELNAMNNVDKLKEVPIEFLRNLETELQRPALRERVIVALYEMYKVYSPQHRLHVLRARRNLVKSDRDISRRLELIVQDKSGKTLHLGEKVAAYIDEQTRAEERRLGAIGIPTRDPFSHFDLSRSAAPLIQSYIRQVALRSSRPMR